MWSFYLTYPASITRQTQQILWAKHSARYQRNSRQMTRTPPSQRQWSEWRQDELNTPRHATEEGGNSSVRLVANSAAQGACSGNSTHVLDFLDERIFPFKDHKKQLGTSLGGWPLVNVVHHTRLDTGDRQSRQLWPFPLRLGHGGDRVQGEPGPGLPHSTSSRAQTDPHISSPWLPWFFRK